MQPRLSLFYAPGSCSRATVIALEEIGCAWEPRLVAFMQREHRTPDFLALNPKGKVPLLLVDGKPLTETVAILEWLDAAFPQAGLLPRADDAFARAKVVSDLAWASSALHGLIARLRFPMMLAAEPAAWPGIRAAAASALGDAFRLIEARLAGREWWHASWSAQDAYLYWVWTRAADGGFDGGPYPAFAAHAARMEARPATRAARALEAEGERELARRGATLSV